MRKQKLLFSERSAFTLAEVLITLAVIGIVAAMTIPTLIQKYQEKVTVTKLKKVYSVLSQAVLQATTEYGSPESWELAEHGKPAVNAAPKIKQFLKLADDCGVNDCENYSIRGGHFHVLSGRLYEPHHYKNAYNLKLADGTELSFRENAKATPANISILADINGSKNPNTLGKDIFSFIFYSGDTNLKPRGLAADPSDTDTDPFLSCNPKQEGWYCTAWVIYFENMDYLRCADELTWNGKHKCD